VIRKSILVTDVDNTLFDWVDIWHRSFSALLDHLIDLSGIPRAVLISHIRKVHQRVGTSEYAFLIEELDILRGVAKGTPVLEFYRPAVEAFREERRRSLRLYPGVTEALLELRQRGVRIAAYTESLAFYTAYRFRKTGLDRLVDVLYSPPDHELPDNIRSERHYPPEHYDLAHTRHHHTPVGELKPNPDILLSIIEDLGGSRDEALYVGDSHMKDVAMAQDAGVLDALASYGAAQSRTAYELLRQVTHRPDEHVDRERSVLVSRSVSPSITLVDRFDEILAAVNWEAHNGS
jgi:phosphoglycolate phosphatase-like HAD superfamily hydrolase